MFAIKIVICSVYSLL